MSATLTLRRHAVAGLKLRPLPLEITVHGATVGSVKKDQTFKATIEPGPHILQVHARRYSSRTQSFEVAGREAINLHCGTRMPWPTYLTS